MQGRLVCAFSVSMFLAGVAPVVAAGQSSERARTGSVRTSSDDKIVEFINQQIREGWTDNLVEPSDTADDAEWLRRVYLDIVGHIPPADDVTSFLQDKDRAKRSKIIDKLLDDPAFVRNWTTIWTNLCIGRRTPRRVSRMGMQKFFREAFAKNRPWNDVVFDLVSAEGHFERNGAVNYLLAQITGRNANSDDYVVQATAKTTRLFMGVQVQCTQCHDHPFNDTWQQDQFWRFNSFFRQVRRVDHRRYDPKSGRQVDDYSELVWRDFSGGVFFEKRNGLVRVAYPQFFEVKIDEDGDGDRRGELAKLMAKSGDSRIARAMANRMWGHFFGYGFTKPVDDMGPHNTPTHPEILDRLTEEFVNSKYDVKKLMGWIANTEAYGLTSRFGDKNQDDNPAAGETASFSHMYVKSMQAEQLYDSLIIATNAHKTGRSSWEAAQKQRQKWMSQFIIAFDTDENDETTTFNGTIPQALMMMNGQLIENAISPKKGSYLNRVLLEDTNDNEKIRKLYLSSLGRYPSRLEQGSAARLVRGRRSLEDKLAAYQDLFWALLNSNEFIFNH